MNFRRPRIPTSCKTIRTDVCLRLRLHSFASTDLSAARLLQNRRFNYALIGMLDCLRQLIAFGKTHGRGWAGGGIE